MKLNYKWWCLLQFPLMPHSKPKCLLKSRWIPGTFLLHVCSWAAKILQRRIPMKRRKGLWSQVVLHVVHMKCGGKILLFVVQKDSGAGGEVWLLCQGLAQEWPKPCWKSGRWEAGMRPVLGRERLGMKKQQWTKEVKAVLGIAQSHWESLCLVVAVCPFGWPGNKLLKKIYKY